jgi:hypothetical protein
MDELASSTVANAAGGREKKIQLIFLMHADRHVNSGNFDRCWLSTSNSSTSLAWI